MAAGQASPTVDDWKDVDESDWKDVNEDELTKQTQVAAKAGGATLVPQTPIQQPLTGNMSKKGLFGENISSEEEQRIASRAASIQNMPSSYQTPLTNAITAIDLAELPGAISRNIAKLPGAISRNSEEAGNWIASKMRKPATSAQSLAGVAGTPKNILPRNMQRWTMPDWVMETVTPAGEKGTITNPGPFNDLPAKMPKPSKIIPTPMSVAERADQAVERQIALKAAKVRAGLEPAAEDDIAEILRNEFLSPTKKSPVPQEISSPRARVPTYAPVAPVANIPAPEALAPSKYEEMAKSAQYRQQAAAVGRPPAPIPQTVAPEAPAVSKLSEGPTALQHQVARKNALNDIRNATINKPGWVSKLPDRVQFEKMTPAEQRTEIVKAIISDPEASKVVRAGARTGSAGDLATWPKEELWTRFMKEYTSPTPNVEFKNSLAEEIKRRGQSEAASHSVRP